MNAVVSSPPVHVERDARAGSGGLSEFFRYHGIWAPGVRLFRSIGFRSKAMVISAVFAIPLVVLAYAYFADKASAIAFSSKERVGVEYAQHALPLLPALHKQRLVAVQEAAKGQALPEAADARSAVAAGLKRLAEAEARLGGELATAKAYATLLERSQGLPSASAGVEPVMAAHNALVQALLDLVTTSTDNSNLTLDPDLDTYYLMDGSLGVIPLLTEATARMRDMAVAVLSGHTPSAAFAKQSAGQEVIASLSDERWAAGVQKVASVHPKIAEELALDETRKALRGFHEVVAGTEAVGKVVGAAEPLMNALMKADEQSLSRLDDLLVMRIDAMKNGRMVTGVVLALSVLCVAYLFVAFRKVLEGGLNEVAHHINAMRDGDLTTEPRAWGADEAARLMLTLSQMQASLRRIVSQVRGASDALVNSSTEISSGAQDLHTRTEQSAANLEETASAMEQIAVTVKNNASTVEEATRLAGDNAQAAERGGQIIGQVMDTMQNINSSSTRISDIIGVIEGIAFQTNILALNAAVEAARAGEQGRGFAVVASEVRALAQRSSSAAKEIKNLITHSVEQVEGGVLVARQAGGAIQDVVGSALRVRELLAQVSVGAREQNAGIAQSTQAVQALDNVTQQNATLVEQTAAAASTLKSQALGLAGEVAQFKLGA